MSWQELEPSASIITQRDQPLSLTVDRLGFHLFTGRLMVAWIALVACTFFVLEQAIRFKEHVPIPWKYSTSGLPALLVTVVAQGHVTITTMYLTRLALSGLHGSFGTPKSWAEMFWLAGAKWSGPVGMFEAVIAAISLRIWRVSKAFLLFCIVSLAAFALPVILESAYTVTTVDVAIQKRCNPYTMSPSLMLNVERIMQVVSGSGGWVTGQSVFALYNRSIYHPAIQSRGSPYGGDFFFAGDIEGSDMTLPGIRVQNDCINRGNISFASLFPTPGDHSTFDTFCQEEIKDRTVYFGNFTTQLSALRRLDIGWCSNTNLRSNLEAANGTSNTSTLIWFSYSDNRSRGSGPTTDWGLAHCVVAMQTGTARLSGRDMSYSSFAQDATLLTGDRGSNSSREPMSSVISAIFYQTTHPGGRGLDEDDSAVIYGQLGLNYTVNYNSKDAALTSEKFTERIRDGLFHMVASLMLLSRTNDATYDCTTHHPVSAFTRNNVMAAVVIALISLWLAGILLATAIMLRPTFSDGLDSHAAARLLLHRPDLMKDVPFGPHDKNKKLAEAFSGIQMYHAD